MHFLVFLMPFVVLFASCNRSNDELKRQEKWETHFVKHNLLDVYRLIEEKKIEKKEIEKIEWDQLVFSDIDNAQIDVRAYNDTFLLVCYFNNKFYFFDERGFFKKQKNKVEKGRRVATIHVSSNKVVGVK